MTERSKERTYTDEEVEARLKAELPHWRLENGWIRRTADPPQPITSHAVLGMIPMGTGGVNFFNGVFTPLVYQSHNRLYDVDKGQGIASLRQHHPDKAPPNIARAKL